MSHGITRLLHLSNKYQRCIILIFRKYFSTALDGIEKDLVVNELKLTPAKSRTILSLITTGSWRQAVQGIIQNKTDQ